MKKRIDKGWAVKCSLGFYCGWWFTRREAIAAHCQDRTWEQCKENGDEVVKVTITEGWPKKEQE